MAIRKRKSAKQIAWLVFKILSAYVFGLIVVFSAVLFFNDNYFKDPRIPTTIEIVRYFGGGSKPYAKLCDNEAAVYFIDVGQGDCELIVTKDYNILIDSGDEDHADKVLGFLKYSDVKELDLVIASHPHSDHIGGMYKVLQKYGARLVLLPETPAEQTPNTLYFEKMLKTCDLNNIELRYAQAGERFFLGDDTYIDILSPVFSDYEDLNDFSVAARFVHGENEFLFMGDMSSTGESDLSESGRTIDSDVLKVAHHGSAGSSSYEFLQKVKPKIAVIEVSAENTYGHPRNDVLRRLEDAGCERIYTTANFGSVLIISDGKELRVETEKRVDNAA